MRIKWLGHAAFLITAADSTRIITDPYETGKGLTYGEINEAADIVTVSHDHYDHANVGAVKGSPVVLQASGEAKGITFRGVATAHDDSGGSQRGANVAMCFTVDDVRVCHLGDLGHPLTAAQQKEIGAVDVLLIPVGGFFTIDAATATKVVAQINPKVIIPMHFKNARCAFPIAAVDNFLAGKNNVARPGLSELEFKEDTLPDTPRIVVMEPAL